MLPLNAPIIGSHEPSDIAAHQLFLAESDFHNVAQELIDNRNLIDGYLLSFTPILRNYTLSVLKTFYSTGDDWWQIGVVRIEKNEDLQSSLRRITNDKSRLAKLDISRCVSIILGNRDAFKDPVSDDGSLLPKLDKEQLECLRKIRNSAEHSVDGFPDEYTENKLYELQEIVGHFDETLAKKIYDKYCELRRKSIIPDYYIPQRKNTLSIFLGVNETSMYFRDGHEIKTITVNESKSVPSCVLINDVLDLMVGEIASDMQCVYPNNRFIKLFHRKFILSDGLVIEGQLFTPKLVISKFFKELLLAFSKAEPNVTENRFVKKQSLANL